MSNNFTIKELSQIFKCSPKATIRHLRNFNIPIQTQLRKRTYIPQDLIKEHCPQLYESIHLTIRKKVQQPFFSMNQLATAMGMSRKNLVYWLKTRKIPTVKPTRRIIIFAASLKQQ